MSNWNIPENAIGLGHAPWNDKPFDPYERNEDTRLRCCEMCDHSIDEGTGTTRAISGSTDICDPCLVAMDQNSGEWDEDSLAAAKRMGVTIPETTEA